MVFNKKRLFAKLNMTQKRKIKVFNKDYSQIAKLKLRKLKFFQRIAQNCVKVKMFTVIIFIKCLITFFSFNIKIYQKEKLKNCVRCKEIS